MIGLNQTSNSIGLALCKAGLESLEVVGFDRSKSARKYAQSIQVAHKVTSSLREAVSHSDLVIIVDAGENLEDIFFSIRPHLEPGTTVTDTSNSKVESIRLAHQILPEYCYYVAGRPVPSASQPMADEPGACAFVGGTYFIVPSPGPPADALQSLIGIAELLGAQPLFIDAAEHDSFQIAISYLPMLVASAFTALATEHPGWQDIRRMAGATFNQMVELSLNRQDHIAPRAQLDYDTLQIWLQGAIEQLREMSHYISSHQENNQTAALILQRIGEISAQTFADAQPPQIKGLSASSLILGEWLANRAVKRLIGPPPERTN